MGYFKFGNGTTKYPGHIKSKTANIITIEFDGTVPQKSTVDGKGATWYNDGNLAMGDYSAFITPYRWHDGIYQLSNDGSVFVPTVNFTSNGGTLTGETVQHVSNYSDLVVPTPVDDSDWEFQNWNPSVPVTGVIYNNETYQAVFEFVGTPPEPVPTLEERVTSLETGLTDTQVGVVESFEASVENATDIENTEVAVAEIYEMILGGN